MDVQLDKIKGRRLTSKLIGYLFIFSIFFTLIHSAIDLKREYGAKVEKINESFVQIQDTILKQLSFSLWQMDDTQLKIQLEGMLKLPGVVFVEIIEKEKSLISVGKKQTDNFKHQYFDLKYSSSDISNKLGQVYVQLSYSSVDEEIWNNIFTITINESFKFFILAFLLLILVHNLIIKHLLKMATYMNNLDIDNLNVPLKLDKSTADNKLDVLDSVSLSINKMRNNLLADIEQKEEAQKQLALSNKRMEIEIQDRIKAQDEIKILNEELEIKVFERTQELEESNEELQRTLSNLKNTQKQLIHSEKMASLGDLVAGVAHEINTPVGMGLTGITHFLEITKDIKHLYENEDMSQEEFEEYVKISNELATSINANLVRAADLIKSFKQVAVDQSSEAKRIFDLKKYLQEILVSLRNITKKTKIQIIVDCPNSIKVNSYPGAFSQIITNLVMNSIHHGFSKNDAGTINIQITQTKTGIKLLYTDDGKGIKEVNLPKIYDPFFTTSREGGGSGLGLNVIYNIITTTLNGKIKCKSRENEGVEFEIDMNIDFVEEETG